MDASLHLAGRTAGPLAVALATALAVAPPVAAESLILVYGGVQSAPSSDVSGEDTDQTSLDFDADWESRPLDPPFYYGLRYAYWRADDWGFYADFTHVKVYASEETLADSGFDRLEFTNGLNPITFGVQRRFAPKSGLTPYLGAGIGFTYPHVETRSPASEQSTFEHQFGGFAAELRAGASYALAARWSLFGEYEGNYIALDVDMDGGGSLETDFFTHALNLGVGFAF